MMISQRFHVYNVNNIVKKSTCQKGLIGHNYRVATLPTFLLIVLGFFMLQMEILNFWLKLKIYICTDRMIPEDRISKILMYISFINKKVLDNSINF